MVISRKRFVATVLGCIFILLALFVARVGAQELSAPVADAGQGLSTERLAALAGVLLSLGFSYLPGLREKWAGLEAVYKRLIMAGLLLVVSVAVYLLSCYQIINSVACTRDGLIELVWIFIAAVIANQSAYAISPQMHTTEDETPESHDREWQYIGDES